MRIQLVDIDSKIPNLALMQLSSWHKQQGDIAGFDINDPDIVYISCVFSKNAEQARGVSTFYPNAEIHVGGSGMGSMWLDPAIQKVKPDYDLYPSEYSMGFTTRGCIRNCPFCIVPEKEGKLQRWQHVSEFHDERFNTVILLDNNITADRQWFFENTDWILENKLRWNPVQGMDIRLLDPEIAERLALMKWKGNLHFAFDNLKDEEAVLSGIELLKNAGINVKHDVQFYVLVGFNTTEEEDKYRCRLLKKHGTNAFVMQYERTEATRKLAHWANRKWLFWSCDVDDVGKAMA